VKLYRGQVLSQVGGQRVFVETDRGIVRELDPKPSQKINNHSPDGFSWGYGGSGPAQLALALLLDCYGEQFAKENYQDFKWDKIATLPMDKGFILSFSEIDAWVTNRKPEAKE